MEPRAGVELGLITTLPSTTAVVAMAKVAEAAGIDRLGLGDTAPYLYHPAYPAATAILLQTERLRVGPYVTNTVTRHWSIHGASTRAFEDIAPGRFFLGLGAGDGAVNSVGLKPATLARFREDIAAISAMKADAVPLHMAFSGPKGIALAGEVADELTIGCGLDVVALRDLAAIARAARKAAGVTRPLRIWALSPMYVSESPDDMPALYAAAGGRAAAGARFSFARSFEGKNVPVEYQPFLKDALARYDFAYHNKPVGNPNMHLFDARPDIRDYLAERFAVIGTPEQCAERLETIIREAGLDGVWLAPNVPLAETDRYMRRLELMGKVLAPIQGIPAPALS